MSRLPELMDRREPGDGTLLASASSAGHLDLVNILLDHGADINDQQSRIPCLVGAAMAGHQNTISCLIHRSANLDIKDHLGRNALFASCEHNHTGSALYLLESGAKQDIVCKRNMTPLSWACRHQNLELVLHLVVGSKHIASLPSDVGATPLFWAAKSEDLKVATLLLENGAQSSLELGPEGHTPLLVAAELGSVEMLRLLLTYGAAPHVISANGTSALYLAASGGFSEVAEVILDQEVDEELAKPDNYKEPLPLAAKKGHRGVCNVLLERSTFSKEIMSTALHSAARFGFTDIAILLLDHGADIETVDFGGNTPLLTATFNGHSEVSQTLLRYGANWRAMNKIKDTPCLYASMKGMMDLVTKLLDSGADPNAVDCLGYTPLAIATWSGNLEIMKLLMERGADHMLCKKEIRWTLLEIAATTGHIHVAKYLLHCGFAPDEAKNDQRRTPLFIAASENHLSMVELFLERGAAVSSRDRRGSTPLFCASKNNNQQMIELFVAHGADVNGRDKDGYTPLHVAAEKGNSEAVESLLAHGANSQAQTSRYSLTPFFAAVSRGQFQTTKLLLEHGCEAQVNEVRGWDRCPLQMAAEKGFADLVELLLSHGADPVFDGALKMTPLSFAAKSDDMRSVQLLLNSEAEFKDLCGNRWSSYNMAAYSGSVEILKTLSSYQKPMDFEPDCEGRTALHLSACGGNVSAFEYLLKAGLDPTVRDCRNRTVLHYAAVSSSHSMVAKILELPILAKILDAESGWTVLHWAARSGDAQLVNRLMSLGMQEHPTITYFPNPRTPWTPWAIARFHANEKLVSAPDCPLKLRNESSAILPAAAAHAGFRCDSCEMVGPLSDTLMAPLT